MNGYTPAELAIRRSGADAALLLIGLVDLEVFYRTHPDAPVPQKPTLNIRIPDSAESREDKIAVVEAVAAALGVSPVWRNGVLYACREFGPLLLECHYTPDHDAAFALQRSAKAVAA